MNRPPEPPPEGVLIETARRDTKLSVREAARRAGISEGWWRQVARGYQSLSGGDYGLVHDVPAATIARMARATGRITPEQLETEGQRPDAAQVLRELRDEPPPPPRLLRPVTPAAADEGESGELAVYLPVIQERLKDLTEAGDPAPSGEVMFDPETDPLGAGPDMAARLVAAWNIAMDAPVDPDTAAVLTARMWVRLREYRAREAARRAGQHGALSRT